MKNKGKEIDITRNLKVIEWLKAELVDAVGALFKTLIKTGNNGKSDALATIIIITYLLGYKIGVSFINIDMRIKDKLENSLSDSYGEEQWYSDLTELLNYLENKKR